MVHSHAGRAPSIEAPFTEGHRRTDLALDKMGLAWEQGSVPLARRLFQQLERELRRHMRVENDILFAAFEQKTGLGATGPTHALRREHEHIAQRLDELTADIEAGADSQFTKHQVSLRALLTDHWSREEKIIFPSCEQLFEDSQKSEVVRALSARSAGSSRAK